MGPRKAERVLVLMPGFIGGAGDLTLVAKDLIKRVDALQVWAADRRSQALEDTSVFEQTLAGERSLQEMFDYYLGWLANPGTAADHFDLLDPDEVPHRPAGRRAEAPRVLKTVIRFLNGDEEK